MEDFIAYLILGIIIIPYIIIGILLIRYKDVNLKYNKSYIYKPKVTIFLPTYNEEGNIARKLDNLIKQDYPKKEILIYDCSDDDTRSIIKDYMKRYPAIKLVEQPYRIGMAGTFNEAMKEAKGEIFIKTDCDSITLSNNAITELVSNFADARVGAVSGITISNKGVEKGFRAFMQIIQRIESYLDSTLIAHSTSLLAFRRELMEEVNPNSMAEDTEEFLLIRKKGYKTIIDYNVKSIESISNDTRRKQKIRRAEGIIRVLLRNRDMIFNKQYGKYGLIVLPLELFILVISPFFLMLLAIDLGYILYILNPTFLGIFGILLGFSIINNSFRSIIDTQLNSLLAFFRAVFIKEKPLWDIVRV